MIKLKNILFEIMDEMESEYDYRGGHTSPDKTNGAPLHDLTKIYPDDIYSSNAARYYGDMGGDSNDIISVNIMQLYKNRPNAGVKIYRAVPYINKEVDDRIKYYNNLISYILQFGFPPIKDRTASEQFGALDYNKEKYINKLNEIVDGLRLKRQKQLKINDGDWVTLNREYAISHGKSTLKNNYKIISRTVLSKHVFTDGNSIHEFGYDPT